MHNIGLKINEVIEILKYGKNNDKYYNKVKLLWQVIKKILPIIETLYSGYSIFFMFDNAISYLVFTEDALFV